MTTKTLVTVSTVFILAAALMVGFLVSRSNVLVQSREMPVFWGEELVVQKADKAVMAGKAIKAQIIPAPMPKAVAPLPIFPPKISYQVLPQYPATALEQGLSGTTLLSIYVGRGGKPEKVEVKTSAGVSELDQAALAAVSKWMFEPARQGGQAIASWFEVPVRFAIK